MPSVSRSREMPLRTRSRSSRPPWLASKMDRYQLSDGCTLIYHSPIRLVNGVAVVSIAGCWMLTTGGTLAIVGGRGIPYERSYEVALGCPEGRSPFVLLAIPREWGHRGLTADLCRASQTRCLGAREEEAQENPLTRVWGCSPVLLFFPHEWERRALKPVFNVHAGSFLDSRFRGNDRIRGVQRGEAPLRYSQSPMNGGHRRVIHYHN